MLGDLFEKEKIFCLAKTMNRFFNHQSTLSDTTNRLGILLIFMFFVGLFILCPSQTLFADPFPNPFYPSAIDPNSAHSQNSFDIDQQNTRRHALQDYVQKEALNVVPGLPDDMRSTLHWAMDGLHASRGLFSLDLSALNDAGIEQTPEAPWLATTYHHHHGLLPTHDAITLGTHARYTLMGDYMGFDFHNYYGQNYFSARNYYGSEFKLDLAKSESTKWATNPWGTMAISYTNGDGRLMDHGRGLDLHGEVHFNERLSLTSGLRQSDTSGSSNYVMLQWKMPLQ